MQLTPGKRIDWTNLSADCRLTHLMTEEFLEHFKGELDWSALSANDDLKLDFHMIDRFIDKWDWTQMLNRYRGEIYSNEFIERYKDRIDPTELFASECWAKLVSLKTEELTAELDSSMSKQSDKWITNQRN